MMRKFLLFFLLLSSAHGFSQDLTGIWRGHFRSTSTTMLRLPGDDDRYKFEVQLDQHDKLFSGVTYSYKTTVFYGKASCNGTVNKKTKKILLEELKIVEVRMAGGDACIMTCFLQYTRSGGEEFLEGTYTSMNIRDSSNCGKGTVFLRKVPTSDFYKEPFLVKRDKEKAAQKGTKITPVKPVSPPPKKDSSLIARSPVKKPLDKINRPVTGANRTNKPLSNSNNTVAKTKPVKPPTSPATKNIDVKPVPNDTSRKIVIRAAPSVITPKPLATRQNELVQTITTSANTIHINIYDNGTIDNDTVSVYVDKKLVLSKQRLTESPLTLSIELDDANDYHELVMVADNLGQIPPNTSLMVVKAGEQQYEVRITSTEQKNAVVVFRYQKP